MSEVVAFSKQPGVSFLIHWIIMDEKACHKCIDLSTRPFTGDNLEGSWLVDREYGPVWDLVEESSMVHPNCRCTLDVEVDIDPEQFKGEGMMVSIPELKEQISELTMSYHELRELETILNRTLTILERMTGSPEVKEAINYFQRLISIVRMAQFTFFAFQRAFELSNPIGWIFAISGAISTTITATDMVASIAYDSTRGR